jgi:Ni,Fe-hydrogenase I cytochrome b subunit
MSSVRIWVEAIKEKIYIYINILRKNFKTMSHSPVKVLIKFTCFYPPKLLSLVVVEYNIKARDYEFKP